LTLLRADTLKCNTLPKHLKCSRIILKKSHVTFYDNVKSSTRLSFVRERLDDLISNSSGFQDTNFEEALHTDFQSRVWELILDRILQSNGYAPKGSPSGGPDFSIDVRGFTVWIEATAPGRGTAADRVPDFQPDNTGSRQVPLDQVVLRFTHAILEKSRQRERHIRSDYVPNYQPYVIAISGAKIYESDDVDPSCALRATLGWSDAMYAIDPRTGERVDERLQRKEQIPKNSGEIISSCAFLTQQFAGIYQQ
jgi:hypothetical protein